MSKEDKQAIEMVRKVVREELDKTEWELPKHTHEVKREKEEKQPEKEEKCDECGTTISRDSKFCKNCGGELDWPE